MMITITMRVNRDEGAEEIFGYDLRVRQMTDLTDLHKLFEKIMKIFCIPVEHVFSTSELFMQPHPAVLAWQEAILCKLVMIKSSIKLQPDSNRILVAYVSL